MPPDFSIVPVDHDPVFDHSLMPVDHDPFSGGADDMIAQAHAQLATQNLRDPATFDPRTYAPTDEASKIASRMPVMERSVFNMLRGAADAATFPGDVYAGRDTADNTGRVTNMALTAMGGAGAAPAEANAVRSGLTPARKSALPMDEASRMARATDMGFRRSMPLYHGSAEEFSSFRTVPTTAPGMATPGVSTALNPEVANEFAAARGSEKTNPQVYQLLHRADRPAVLTLDGSESHGEVVSSLRDAFERGHDAVMIKNYTTPGGLGGQNIVIVRDANQLRSPNAAFDPAKRDSSFLLATGATDPRVAAVMQFIPVDHDPFAKPQ
jgi:hypothetical protein